MGSDDLKGENNMEKGIQPRKKRGREGRNTAKKEERKRRKAWNKFLVRVAGIPGQ